MKINLRVVYNDGAAVDTAATTPDLMGFEDRFNKSITIVDTELRLTHLLWLAWASLTRQGKTAATFEDWCNSVDSCVLTDGEATPVPLEREPAPTSES